MADIMSIDKKEMDHQREGSEDSMELNSPTPEPDNGAPAGDNPPQQKRKGGRKPVRALPCPSIVEYILMSVVCRYMRLQKNVNSATAKRKQLSENVGQSISSNWRKPFAFMRIIFITCRLPTGVLRTNV